MAHRLAAWLVVAGLMAFPASPARAAWSRSGNPVCTALGAQHDPIGVSPWIVWTDERHGPAQVYVSRFDSFAGTPEPPEAVDGVRAAPSSCPQLDVVAAVSDLYQSLFVAWSEDRGSGTGRDIYMMRLVGGAPAAGWPADGVPVCVAQGDQVNPRLVASHPHALVSWEDSRAGTADLYAMDVSADGTHMPGWPPNGRAIVTNEGADRNEALLQPGDWQNSGYGFSLVWTNGGRVLIQVIADDGGFLPDPAWPPAGRVLSDPAYAASAPRALVLRTESGARCLVAWLEERDGIPQVRAQGVMALGSPGGTLFAPEAIAAVPDPLARPIELSLRQGPYVEATVVLRDQRADPGDLYAQRLQLPVPLQPDPFEPVGSAEPLIVFSGTQGTVISTSGVDFWVDDRSGVPQVYTSYDFPAPPAGVAMGPTHAPQSQPSSLPDPGPPVADAPFRVVVVWTDMRNPATAPDIFAQALGQGGPGVVGVPLTPSSATAVSLARPNPTRGSASFTLSLARDSDVRLDIVDLAGRRLRELVRARVPSGALELRWDGNDDSGAGVSPGLYWLRGRIGDAPVSRRMVLLSP